MICARVAWRAGLVNRSSRPALPFVLSATRGFRGRDFLDEIHAWRDKVFKFANPSSGAVAGGIDPWKASVSSGDNPDKGENKPGPVVEALRANSLGFGFSAGGMLFPYYIGVVEALEEMGIMKGMLLERLCSYCSSHAFRTTCLDHSLQPCLSFSAPPLSQYKSLCVYMCRGHKDRRRFSWLSHSSLLP